MTRTVTMLTITLAIVWAGCETPQPTSEPKPETVISQKPIKADLLAQIDRKYENPEAHYQLGKIYFNEGALDKADFEYRVAVGFDPVHYRAQAGIVRVLVDQEQPDRAQIIAELYVTQTAVSPKASMRLGKAFQDEGLGEYALSCYYQAAGLDPESPEPYRLLGLYYLQEGDKMRAEENLRRSFELDPYQSDVSGELGRLGVIVQTPHKPAENIPQPPVEE